MTMRSPPCSTCEAQLSVRAARVDVGDDDVAVRLASDELACGGKRERLAVRRVDERGSAFLGARLLAARCFLREDHGLGRSLRCGSRDCGACAGEGFPSVHRGFCPARFFLRLEGLVVVVVVIIVVAIVVIVVIIVVVATVVIILYIAYY